MKIISKYKDFYDYIVQDHDADITYIRNMNIVDISINNYLKDVPGFNKYNSSIYFRSNYYRTGRVDVANYIFGIYPYIYSQPVIRILKDDYDFEYIILDKEIVDNLLSDDKNISKHTLQDIKTKCQYIVDRNNINKNPIFYVNKYESFEKDLKNDIKKNIFKIENKDIFTKLNSPVFVYYHSELFDDSVYAEQINHKSYKNGVSNPVYCITDISFQKLKMNILKYWWTELNDLNTYINIENFLWSIKQEPESVPDNKTKIISHGFDLKESFRNIK